MAPQRRDGSEFDLADELPLVFGIANREVQIGRRRHVEHRDGDCLQGPFDAAIKTWSGPYVVAFPRTGLEDVIVRVGALESLDDRFQRIGLRASGARLLPPELAP